MPQPFSDDALDICAADGPPALPPGGDTIERDGTRLWFASWGQGAAVLLLHGGMGNASNFGHQVPALLDAGYRVIVMYSRGHAPEANRVAKALDISQVKLETSDIASVAAGAPVSVIVGEDNASSTP